MRFIHPRSAVFLPIAPLHKVSFATIVAAKTWCVRVPVGVVSSGPSILDSRVFWTGVSAHSSPNIGAVGAEAYKNRIFPVPKTRGGSEAGFVSVAASKHGGLAGSVAGRGISSYDSSVACHGSS